jgi:hypothetical protein
MAMVLVLIGCVIYGIRNDKVCAYRISLIDKMYEATNIEWNTLESSYHSKRDEIFESISYDAMWLKCWKRFDSFYTKEEMDFMITPPK